MSDVDKIGVSGDYKEFVKTAEEVAAKDLALYPLEKHEARRDRFEKHLIGMIAMYESRYGSAENPYKSAWLALKSVATFGIDPKQEAVVRIQIAKIESEFKIDALTSIQGQVKKEKVKEES